MKHQYVLCFSGGKDSTATLLYLIKEKNIVPIVTFQDTGNESKDTYAYIDYISGLLNGWTGTEVIKLKGEYDFFSLAIKKKRFPSMKARFCTEWLKIVPFLRWLEEQPYADDCTIITGIRAAESKARSKRKEHEDKSTYGRPLWNPIITWSAAEVFAIHKKYRIDINPLYKKGLKRVGCFPCVNAGRNELIVLARHYPDRIAEIREVEKQTGLSYLPRRKFNKITGEAIVWTIDQHVAWALKTLDGQMELGTIKQESTICAYAGLGVCE
ncbi:MAG: phosphoadenosine phosphosulfate reductase family protein [Candidatus Omnitrophica bacterium]|nr:phosphoadenosine phosphosulfate reductase family protein [Candidatus Omnitrophota bacterium]